MIICSGRVEHILGPVTYFSIPIPTHLPPLYDQINKYTRFSFFTSFPTEIFIIQLCTSN